MTNVPAELHQVGKIDRGIMSRFFEVLADPDLLVVCGFAVVGLLLTICLARVLPFDDAINVLALAN